MYVNAAAMEALTICEDDKARNIFYIVDEVGKRRSLDSRDILVQIAKLDLRYTQMIEAVL